MYDLLMRNIELLEFQPADLQKPMTSDALSTTSHLDDEGHVSLHIGTANNLLIAIV